MLHAAALSRRDPTYVTVKVAVTVVGVAGSGGRRSDGVGTGCAGDHIWLRRQQDVPDHVVRRDPCLDACHLDR